MEITETTHPCEHCVHYQGRHEIETLDTMGLGRKLKVEIPICGRIIYVLAIRKCDKFVPTDVYMSHMNSKIKEEEDIKSKYINPNSPAVVGGINL